MFRLLIAASLIFNSCIPKKVSTESSVKQTGVQTDAVGQKKFCAAIRGNGELIMAHVSGLARILEDMGMVDGAAGSSSSSLTVFFYESILMNPAVTQCNGTACSDEQKRERAALLVKTLWAYLNVLSETPEAKAILNAGQFFKESQIKTLEQLEAEGKFAQLHIALLTLFNSPEMKPLMNPEVIAMLSVNDVDLRNYYASEIVKGLKVAGSFDVPGKEVFFRPGIVSFEGVAKKAGHIADFLSGNVPPPLKSKLTSYVDSCAPLTKGKRWFEIVSSAQTQQCASTAVNLITEYRATSQGVASKRNLDLVGGKLPVLINTAVLIGQGAEDFRKGQVLYMRTQDPNKAAKINKPFQDYVFKANSSLKIGYWGAPSEVAPFMENVKGYDDEKTRRRFSLGQVTWDEILSLSPAEPGLARFKEIPNSTDVSAGGWADLHPMLALRSAGCEKIVYLTRQGGDSNFAQGIARELGVEGAEHDALYALNQDSAFSRSIKNADAVYCTDWNTVGTKDLDALDKHVVNSPIYSKDPAFASFAKDPETAPDGCR